MLHMHDPNQKAESLLDLLTKTTRDADTVLGMFAFATAYGVHKFFNLEGIQNALHAGEVRLVIGLDAITNSRTLDALATRQDRYRDALNVKFLIPSGSGIFHPKITLATRTGGGSLVVGSGNLTGGGLERNVEASMHVQLDVDQTVEARKQLFSWMATNAARLRDTLDDEARIWAKKNDVLGKRTERCEPTSEEDNDPKVGAEQILVRELSRNRLSGLSFQADVGKAPYRDFFGLMSAITIELRGLDAAGNDLGSQTRTGVTVESQNYRLELSVPKNVNVDGAVLLAARRSTTHFDYLLVDRSSIGCEMLSSLLEHHNEARAGGKRYAMVDAEKLYHYWPDAPL